MNGDRRDGKWEHDRYGLIDAPILAQLAELLEVPAPARSGWHAAVVTFFAVTPLGVASAYVQHVQDLDLPISEEALVRKAIDLLQQRADHLRNS